MIVYRLVHLFLNVICLSIFFTLVKLLKLCQIIIKILLDFLEHNITSKLRNKLIILDNASAHRNERIKALVNKQNNILYAVPYQHFTNSIENYFSMLKSRLQKLDGLKYENLKENINKVIGETPKEKYENIFKGAYERPEKYVPRNITRKVKKIYK